jgi:hypothetical protein
MAGFSEQRQQLRNALLAAGLSPDAATQIANILGNSSQSLRHAGPVEIDTTPADLRFVEPEQRKQRFPNLDFRDADPDHRPQRTATSENREAPKPAPNIAPVLAPQQSPSPHGVAPGALTDVAGNGEAARVDVRHFVAANPADGLPMAMLDAQANRLVGKSPRAQVGPDDGSARLEIQETGREVVWNLQMLNRSEYDVVTKIEYVSGRGLEVTYERIKAWDQQRTSVDTIPVEERDVVTEILDDSRGLRGSRRTVPVFESRGAGPSYFNTFRVGTFEDDWPIGTTKEVTQVWPTSDLVVNVVNYTRDIADASGQRYVIFAARTESEVTPQSAESGVDAPQPVVTDPPLRDVNGEIVDSDPDGEHAPAVEYVAIEIQNSQNCRAFHSLDGKQVSDLPGYLAYTPAALSYGTVDQPCLEWRSHTVDVITDVVLSPGGLTFSRKTLYVLGEAEGTEPLVIPVTSCPDPPPSPPPSPDPPSSP